MTVKVGEIGHSLHAVTELRRCGNTSPFLSLNLKKNRDKRSMCMYKLVEQLPMILKLSGTEEEAKKKVEEFFSVNYKEELFDFPALYEVARERDQKKAFRFLAYFYSQKWEVEATQVLYRVPVNSLYRGERIEYVYGKADVVLRKEDGSHVAVQICLSPLQYSYGSRKISNMIKNSIELSSMYLGLSERYPALSVALWSLTSKDDKKGHLEEVFESKKGENIVSCVFEDKEEAWNSFLSSVAVKEERDCRGCRYYYLCRMQEYRAGEGAVVAEEKKTSKTYSLTPNQEVVMHHVDGPMAVIAVPGSGKTFSLIRRLEYLIEEEKVDPDSILFVTFTKKAADEIRSRAMAALDGVQLKNIHTFNSLGYSILREHPECLDGRDKLAEKVDRYMLIEECLKNAPILKWESYDGITGEFGLLCRLDNDFAFIDREGREAFECKYAVSKDVEGIFVIYEMYKALYEKKGYIDYDDQILLSLKLLQEREDILNEYQRRYRYVMVDEFQDVSKEQCELVYRIAEHGNIVVVGDDDQSIYGWRGGSNRFILDFQTYWSNAEMNAEMVIMEDNFRSLQPILNASNELIQNNEERYLKSIVAHNLGGSQPVYYRGISVKELATFISELVKRGMKPGSLAVLSRTNKALFETAKELEGYGIRSMMPKILVTEDAVFQSFHDLFTLYYEGLDKDEALYRILKRLGCDLSTCKLSEGGSLLERLVQAEHLIEIDLFEPECLSDYERLKDSSVFFKSGYQVVAALKEILYSGGIQESVMRIFNILFEEETHPVLEYFISKCEEKGIQDLRSLYEYMVLMYRYNDTSEIEYPEKDDCVNLLTAHKSKGREYPVVVVFGCEEFEDTEEGRCLLYVAMTRAKRLLFLTEAKPAPLFPEIRKFVTV